MIKLIPLPYRILLSIVAIALVSFGLYFYGYETANQKNKLNNALVLSEKNLEVEKLKTRLAEAGNKVVVQYVDRGNVIKEKETNNVQVAKGSVPRQYNLSTGWVYTHDAAANSEYADATRASNETPSDVKDNQALATIVTNYSVCNQNTNQLMALQQWITTQQSEINKKNPK